MDAPNLADKLKERAEAERIRKAEFQRKARARDSEIGSIPPVVDPVRRAACELDLHAFLVAYFPHSCGLAPYGPAQITAIKRLEHSILSHGKSINLLPRGYCKSSISERACIWAALYGHRRFILFLGANEDSASAGIEAIKTELAGNPLLLGDFPEVCHPVSKLEGKHQRANSQTVDGAQTHQEWTASKIVLPTVAGSVASGAIISADGLLSASRGARHTRHDGTVVRPELCIIDDPQTDQSALSFPETSKRLRIITHSLSHLGGHGCKVSICMNATLIAPGDLVDQLTDRRRHKSWSTVKAATVEQMPTALESHWLKDYARLLTDFDEKDIDGQRVALDNATTYYQANREIMDDGAVVSWPDIPLEPGEVSALQHALNVLILEGQSVFDSELQNQPAKLVVANHLSIPKTIGSRFNGLNRLEPLDDAGTLVFSIDVHDEILYYSRATVRSDFTGAIVDYGTLPAQPTAYFSHNAVKRTLAAHYGTTVENAIRLGLIELIKQMALPEMPVNCGLIDAGYKPDIVDAAIRSAGVANVYSSKGLGIGPTEKPMSEYDLSPKRCRKKGPDPWRPRWYFPTEYYNRVHCDSNYWKEFAVARLTQLEISGGWTLYGNEHTDHSMYADHLQSEQPVPMSARGRTVNVFKALPNRDTHYWDTLYMCTAAASIAGAALEGMPVFTTKPRPKPRRQYGVSPLKC